jgi:hypothetical protein
MYQTIAEPIAVAGVYAHGHFQPKKFQWRQRTFVISEVTSAHDFKDGSVRKRRFSALADKNLYLLEFNLTQETWQLEQIWVEE